MIEVYAMNTLQKDDHQITTKDVNTIKTTNYYINIHYKVYMYCILISANHR